MPITGIYSMNVLYKGGYKYQLQESHASKLQIQFPPNIESKPELGNDWVTITKDRDNSVWLYLQKKYAWDGPSGPTIDTKTFMRGSLIHDALYQLMRERILPPLTYRKAADKELRRICLEDGMNPLRAWYVYWGVRLFAAKYADPIAEHPVEVAP